LPPGITDPVFTPLPGATTRGVAFSEWETSRVDAAGTGITVTFDDSNLWVDRDGKLNGNTGDTDASGLNITDATDSIIYGTESADEAPWQTAWQAIVDIATGSHTSSPPPDEDSEDDGDANDPDPGADGPEVSGSGDVPEAPEAPDDPTSSETPEFPLGSAALKAASAVSSSGANPIATAAYHAFTEDSPSSTNEEWDFPYLAWTQAIGSGGASAVHTDEGTTLASGQDALVVGADGYDDDDIRVVGTGITVTRDDGNVTLGGTGDVNSQIGDSEQGAVIMDVTRVFVQGGGAY
jgi:hypothetical protein